jgi:hypothetical protein
MQKIFPISNPGKFSVGQNQRKMRGRNERAMERRILRGRKVCGKGDGEHL